MKKAKLKINLLLSVLLSLSNIPDGNCQLNSNALSWSMNTAYNNYLMRDVHQQYAYREK